MLAGAHCSLTVLTLLSVALSPHRKTSSLLHSRPPHALPHISPFISLNQHPLDLSESLSPKLCNSPLWSQPLLLFLVTMSLAIHSPYHCSSSSCLTVSLPCPGHMGFRFHSAFAGVKCQTLTLGGLHHLCSCSEVPGHALLVLL